MPSLADYMDKHASLYNNQFLQVNWQIPTQDNLCLIFAFGRVTPYSEDEPWEKLLDTFINSDDTYRNTHLKLVAKILQGPYLVRKITSNIGVNRPAIQGTKLDCKYYINDQYIEIDIDLSSIALSKMVSTQLLYYSKSLSLDIGFVLEGADTEELPERFLCMTRLCRCDLQTSSYKVELPLSCSSEDIGYDQDSQHT